MTTAQQGLSITDRLKDTLMAFLRGQVDRLASSASDRLSDVTNRLVQAAESDGPLPAMGARLLKGESPVKPGDVKDAVLGKLSGGSGGKGGDSGVKTTYIAEELDVGVPLRSAYDHWTEYERFGGFTKGVQEVTKQDETTSNWSAKVAFSTRSWRANVLEQIPDDRIVWRTEGGQGTTHGAVSFHELGPTLTRILLAVEYQPSGFMEKTGNLWRAQGRRMRLDFKNFQRYVTFAEEEPEGWRGEIRDGDVVVSHEDAMKQEQAEREPDGESPDGESPDGESPEGQSEDRSADDEAARQDEPGRDERAGDAGRA